jgi:hypothetical protein
LPGRLLLSRRRYDWGEFGDSDNDETAFAPPDGQEDGEESDDEEKHGGAGADAVRPASAL